jgi:hypothetical protein
MAYYILGSHKLKEKLNAPPLLFHRLKKEDNYSKSSLRKAMMEILLGRSSRVSNLVVKFLG